MNNGRREKIPSMSFAFEVFDDDNKIFITSSYRANTTAYSNRLEIDEWHHQRIFCELWPVFCSSVDSSSYCTRLRRWQSYFVSRLFLFFNVFAHLWKKMTRFLATLSAEDIQRIFSDFVCFRLTLIDGLKIGQRQEMVFMVIISLRLFFIIPFSL